MAIIGSLKEIYSQVEKSPLMKEALVYLLRVDMQKEFSKASLENKHKVEVNGDKIFAIYQVYNSKDEQTPKFEGHKEYVDIQFVYEGEELMHIAPKTKIVEDDVYNEAKDVYFPKVEEYSTLRLDAGLGCVLYPEDLHSPNNCIGSSALVKKIVVKVAVE